MKKSTLILLLVAAVAGAAVYYLEIKPGKPRDEKPDTTRTAFNFKTDDIASITITRGAETFTLDHQEGKWSIKQPVNAAADETAANSLAGDLASARVESEFPPENNNLKGFGLDQPAAKVEIKLKDGKTHRIELGTRDVIGNSAYARIDGSQNVAVIGSSLLASADKSLGDFRDRTLLGATQYELNSIKFNNENGAFELAKKDQEWVLKNPDEIPAEEGEVSMLLTEISTTKAAEVVSETDEDLAKFGLNKPKVTITAQLAAGGQRVITAGPKIEDKYYAKVSDRTQIYRIEPSFYEKLNSKAVSLRSKNFVKLDRDDLTRAQVKNPNLVLVAEKNVEGKWLIKEPADKKDKEAQARAFLDPLETKSLEILDKPTAAISAKLARPAVEIRLTGKSGKTTVIKISSADGDNAYLRVEGKPEVYKISKTTLESLSFKIDDVVSVQ